VDLQNLLAARLVGDADLDLAVEPAGPAQRGIDRVDAIGRRDDDNLASRLEAVHHGQQLCDDAAFDLARDVLARGAMESSSSMKMIDGDSSVASSKISLSCCSDSP